MNLREKRIFATLFLSIFSTVTGVGIVVPLLPVYAKNLGASGLYIGLLFGAFSLSRTFFLPYFGKRSDRKGRKPSIVMGLFCYTLISFVFMLATSVEMLIAVRFIQGIASAMIMPVAQAYVGDITPPGREGFTMGLFNMSAFIGLSIGPLMGGVLNDIYSLNMSFAAMGALSGISVITSLIFLPPVSSEDALNRPVRSQGWIRLMKNRHIAALFLFRFIHTACISIVWGFLPVYADAEFGLSGTDIGILVMMGVFTGGTLQPLMGHAADRSDKRKMIILGGLIIVIAMMAYEQARGFRDLFAANIVFGLGGSIIMAPLMALGVQKGAQHKAMGSVMGLITLGHSVGMMTGSLGAGGVMDLLGMRQVFSAGCALMLAGMAVFLMLTLPGGSFRKRLYKSETDKP